MRLPKTLAAAFWRRIKRGPADVAVRPQPADHRPAGRDHADRRDLRLLRSPLADGERPSDRGAGRRRRHDRAQTSTTTRRPRNLAALEDRAQKTLDLSVMLQPEAESARRPPGLAVRRGGPLAAARIWPIVIDAPFWFDTARYPGLCRRAGDDAARRPPLHRAEGPGVRHAGPHLPALADRRDAVAHRDRRRLHPQPGPGDRAPGRRPPRRSARASTCRSGPTARGRCGRRRGPSWR